MCEFVSLEMYKICIIRFLSYVWYPLSRPFVPPPPQPNHKSVYYVSITLVERWLNPVYRGSNAMASA